MLELELTEMRERYWGRKKKKEDFLEESKAPAKKRGAPLGHPGWFRKIAEKIDHLVEVTLERCPKCQGTHLSRFQEFEDHVQEDVVFPKVEATCFRHYRYWCKDCKEEVEAVGPPEELPNSYIGPTAKSIAVWLKYDIKISDRDLKRVFETLLGLRIVPASVANFRKQLARYGKTAYEQIRQALQKSAFVHSDETGWRVGPKKQWLWSLSNQRLSLFHVDPSRGLQVLRKLLGETFPGTLIADFLAVYNKYKARHIQRCLIHLLREIRKMLKVWKDDPAVVRYLETLKAWIQQARSVAAQYKKRAISKDRFQQAKADLQNQLQDFQLTTVQKKPLLRIQKRLNKHQSELLTFLDHPNVDSDNNRAERQIRPNVLLRKITFGNDSPLGAFNHDVFASIIQTAKLNGRSPPDVLRKLVLQRKRKQNKLPLLGVTA
jgi:hypothetical protein